MTTAGEESPPGVPGALAGAGVEIVGFRPDYAPAFRALNLEWLERWFCVEPLDEQVLDDPEREILKPGGDILFARRAGRLVGTVALKHHGDGVYELTKMAVTAGCRGGGIGRRLLSAAVRRYQELGGRCLYLESHSSLAPALHLYESAGFRHTRRKTASEYRRADVYMVYEGPGTPASRALDSALSP
ncbi:MAG TPA: GNAT family N-acetyltransferase [Woeseiaceae bacterium]|nr:GNAT family N-acetyltransferase [Woeseiaceae bacterium]